MPHVDVSLRGRTLQAVLLVAFCCAQSSGQAPAPNPSAPDTAEVSSREAPVTFSSRVNLVSVPVVVRDREGRAVGNLRQEDFQLLDKGKLQVITKFSVEKSGAAAIEATPAGTSRQPAPVTGMSVLPERYIAYLFDDVHLKTGDLLRARQTVNRHLDESLDATARAAIFTTSGKMLTDFTGDREKLHRAINSIQPWTSGPDPQQDCPPISYYVADLLVNKLLYFDGFLFTDEQLSAMLKSGQADQALRAEYTEAVACGVESTNNVGITTHLADPAIDVLHQIRKVARLVLAYCDRENTFALGAIEDVVRRLLAVPGSRTIVLVSPGFSLTRDHLSKEYAALDRAIRANVTINTIDMRGLYTTIPGGDAGNRRGTRGR